MNKYSNVTKSEYIMLYIDLFICLRNWILMKIMPQVKDFTVVEWL